MTIVNNCLLCFKEIEEDHAPTYSPKLLELCLKYLHSSFAQDLIRQSRKDRFPFCSKCFRSAEELVDINEQMECFQKHISELVFIFSLEILHRRGQTTVFTSKVSNDNAFVKNLVEFDVSLLSNGTYWNNTSTSVNNPPQTKNSHNISSNVYEEEISEPLLIPITPADENPIVDIVIEEIKFEDMQQNFVDDNDDTEEDYFNCKNAVLSQSSEKELHSFSTGKVNNALLPVLKLQRLQFYDSERKVTVLESGSVNSIGVNGGIGEMKIHTVWTRCEFGDSYRCINKYSSFENRARITSGDLGSSKKISLPVCPTDVQISDLVVDTNVSKTKSSTSFDNPNCQLKASTEQLPRTAFNKELKTEQTLLEHTRIHTRELPFKCNFCDNAFTSESCLLLHTKSHSEVKRAIFEESDSVSNCSKSLKVHKRVNHRRSPTREDPYSCEVCKRRFKTKQHLLIHERTHSGKRSYKCDVCDRIFSQQGNLMKHKRVHTGEKPYKCDVCERTFAVQGNMLSHKKVHTGEKPYKCNVCERTFALQCNMSRHKNVHTGEKPYKCNVCDRKFAHQCNMSRHKMVHTGEKPFKCDTCDYSSCRRSSLKVHKIYKHSDSMNFRCRECEKHFKTARAVKQHYTRVHFALDFSDECVLKCS